MRNNHSSFRQAFWLAGWAVLLNWPTLVSADQEDLLSLVRTGHRSARESIRSFSAAVSDKIAFATPQLEIVLTGHYWRSLDVVRIQEKQKEGTDDYLVKDSEIRQVGRGVDPQRNEIRHVATRRAATVSLCVLDVWRLMMIDYMGPSGRYNLDDLFERAKETPKVTREKKDGRNCIRVDLGYSEGEWSGTKWFDVDHNYLIWKSIATRKGSSDSTEAEILEFSEPSPGVFIPMKCRQLVLRGGERASLSMITLSEVQVNQPIPKSVLQLPAIPAGTILNDRIQRTSYPIDSDWRPLGPARHLPQLDQTPTSDRPAPDYHSQSATEPVPFSRQLIIASLVLLVIVCTCLLYRRFRLQSGPPGLD